MNSRTTDYNSAEPVEKMDPVGVNAVDWLISFTVVSIIAGAFLVIIGDSIMNLAGVGGLIFWTPSLLLSLVYRRLLHRNKKAGEREFAKEAISGAAVGLFIAGIVLTIVVLLSAELAETLEDALEGALRGPLPL